MFPKLFDILICPECKGCQLKTEHTKSQDDEIWCGEIICQDCNRIYPIKEGIPCLLNNEQLEAMDDSHDASTHTKKQIQFG